MKPEVQAELDRFLAHHGVKGMKWGVRRAEKKAAKAADKADAKWVKDVAKSWVGVYNGAADSNNAVLKRLNNDPRFKNQDFRKPSALRSQYYEEMRQAFEKNYNDSAAKVLPKNPTGRLKVSMTLDNPSQFPSFYVDATDAMAHADSLERFQLNVEYDDMGYISSINVPAELMQTDITEEDLDAYLEHYGVKGMKWGVHRTRGSGTVSSMPRSAKQMTDEELQRAVDRLNLEQRYHNLNVRKTKRGHEKVKELLAIGTTVNAAIAFAASPAGKIVIKKVSSLMAGKEAAGIPASMLT